MMSYAAIRQDGHGGVSVPVYRALQAADGPRTMNDLHRATGAPANSIQLVIKRLEQAGLVDIVADSPRAAVLKADAPAEFVGFSDWGRRVRTNPTARTRLWRAMRILRAFELPELMLAAQTSRRSAETFIHELRAAKYLRTVKRGNPMTGDWSRYVLTERSGPRTPVLRKSRHPDGHWERRLYDPNRKVEFDITGPRARTGKAGDA